jgi:endonuclease III
LTANPSVRSAKAQIRMHAVRLLQKEEIIEIFERFKAKNPEPTTELEYRNVYTLLVAVVLSAQATDISVNKATRALFAAIDNPHDMLALGEDGLIPHIRTIGLYKGKARNVIALSKILIDRHGGCVPSTREALEALPGVGRKTANVVLNTFFGAPLIAVDTHVFRVANRMGLARAQTPLAVEMALDKRIPSAYKQHAHHWLILHGRYVCKARLPLCARCPIGDLCQYPKKAGASFDDGEGPTKKGIARRG